MSFHDHHFKEPNKEVIPSRKIELNRCHVKPRLLDAFEKKKALQS